MTHIDPIHAPETFEVLMKRFEDSAAEFASAVKHLERAENRRNVARSDYEEAHYRLLDFLPNKVADE